MSAHWACNVNRRVCDSSTSRIVELEVHHQVDFVWCRTARLNKNSCGEVIIEVTLYCCWHFDNPKWRSQDLIGKKFSKKLCKNIIIFFKIKIQPFWFEKKEGFIDTVLQIKNCYSLKYILNSIYVHFLWLFLTLLPLYNSFI